MDLLQHLYDADRTGGSVRIDDVNIKSYNVHFLRQRVGIVAQKTVLFKTTVRENIWYGMANYPGDDAIKESLEKAQAWDFIQEKPDKLLTMLTETGGGFSGGQMQRLAIARCLIRKPDVVLLDEATAALDPVNERKVQDTLDTAMKGYTTLAIAHRLTTIKDADKIIVLDKGTLVEEGHHKDLVKKEIQYKYDDDGNKTVVGGYYRNQWETQFNEQGLTTSQLDEKILQLREEIKVLEAKRDSTTKNMTAWKGKVRGITVMSSVRANMKRGERQAEEHPAMPELDRVVSAHEELL
jgi:ABC-type phosphate transport system ATPase subunit